MRSDPLQNVASILAAKGGRLEPLSVDGAAGRHLEFAGRFFQGYLEPILVAPRGSPVAKATPPSKVSEFAFVSRWDINAWAILAEERPIVLFHAGVPFGLTALFNTLLAQTTIAPDLYEGGTLAAHDFRAPPFEWSNIPKGRWPEVVPLTASELAAHTKLDVAPVEGAGRLVHWLHYQSPRAEGKGRQKYATEAYLTAMNFLFCHELGHIDRGHLELRCRSGFSLEENPSPEAEKSFSSAGIQILRALEFDADCYAIMQTITVFREPNETAERRQIRYRRTAFAVGAMLLFLEYARRPTGMFSRLWRALFTRESTHPEPLLRIRYLLICLRVSAAQEQEGSEGLDEALRLAVDDLRAAAKLLRVKSVEALPYPEDDDAAAAAPMGLKLAEMKSALETCRNAVSERYYLNGTLVQEGDPASIAADPWGLRGQSLVFHVDDEEVRIPFLEETAPVEAFLQNSEAWEKVGYLDNAMLYAMHAAERAPASAATHARIKALDARLQPHGPRLRETLTAAGLPTHLAEKVAESADVPLEQWEMLVLARPKEAYFRLGAARARYACRDWSGALALFDEAAAFPETDTDLISAAQEGAGNCHVELGRTELAVACFNRVLARDPDAVSALANLGIGLVRGGKPAEAVAPLERAVDLEPTAAELWFFASAAHHALGDLASTRSHLERALELAPDEPRYQAALEQLHAEEARC